MSPEAKTKTRAGVGLVAVVCLSLSLGSSVYPRPQSPVSKEGQKAAAMPLRASGTFEVKLRQEAPADESVDADLGRMSIDKQVHGDLEGTSRGQMLTAGSVAKGSGGYVAIERVRGTLHGRSGTFVLQHSGTMTRAMQQLSITVVPDSGTGQLVGLAGKMGIKIEGGVHSYDFEYTLAEAP